MVRRTESQVAQLLAVFESMSDPARGREQQRYLKSPLTHLGLGVPQVRTEVQVWSKSIGELTHDDLWSVVDRLWINDYYEPRLAAVELLKLRQRDLGAADLDPLRRMIARTFTWALVDPLAIDVVSRVTDRMSSSDVDQVLDGWAQADCFWVRRAALLSQLRSVRTPDSDPDRFLRYADAMLGEPEFFIRKAIGWVLREMSKKRPDLVFEWLLPRASSASSVTLREATKYLDADQTLAISLQRSPLT